MMSQNGQLNIEIKAKLSDPQKIRDILEKLNADYKGCDHQIDTYFKCKEGRLKLRSGNIENSLIFYERKNQKGPKSSNVLFERLKPGNKIKNILTKVYDIKIEVNKQRHIYFIDNVKFHVDSVEGLGKFVEIEAIDSDGKIGPEKLNKQCNKYIQLLGIRNEEMIEESYSDLLLRKLETLNEDGSVEIFLRKEI